MIFFMGRKKRRTRKLNGAGSITKLNGNRSKPWIVRGPAEIQIDGTVKRPIIGYFKTSEDAEIALSMYKVKPYNIDEKNTTFGELYKLYVFNKEKELVKATLDKYKKEYDNHLSKLENRPIRELKYSNLQPILDKVPKNTSSTLKIIINGIYTLALKNDIVEKDISQLLEISKFTTRKVDRNIYSIEEIKKFRNLSDTAENKHLKDIADMLLIMLYSGMRSGEVRLLKTENIFLNENYVIGGIKTEAGKNRIIPIHPKIYNIIKFHLNSEKKFLFETRGKEYSEANFKKHFKNVKQILGIEYNYNRHSTRHTFVTKLKQLGISEGKLKKIIGHKSKDITDGVYTHYTKDDLLEEVKKLDYGE